MKKEIRMRAGGEAKLAIYQTDDLEGSADRGGKTIQPRVSLMVVVHRLSACSDNIVRIEHFYITQKRREDISHYDRLTDSNFHIFVG